MQADSSARQEVSSRGNDAVIDDGVEPKLRRFQRIRAHATLDVPCVTRSVRQNGLVL